MTTQQTLDLLKAAGHYFTAGAFAREAGLARDSYGCRMEGEKESAKEEFWRGYDAAGN